MRALAVRQPWASLIAEGAKPVEWRSWSTPHRGPLLICASSSWAPGRGSEWEIPEGFEARFPRGVAVCVVDLTDVAPFRPEHLEAAGLDALPDPTGFAWLLRDPRPVTPVPVRGRLHLFEVDLSA